MNCFFCGAKISNGEINSARRRAGVCLHCPRFRYLWRCGQCNQTFDYRRFLDDRWLQKHKELFKNTLININRRFLRNGK